MSSSCCSRRSICDSVTGLTGPWTGGRRKTTPTSASSSMRTWRQTFTRRHAGWPSSSGRTSRKNRFNSSLGELILTPWRNRGWRSYGAPFVSEVRQSGPWRTSVTGRWDGLLKQTARIPHADCCKSPPGRAVGSGRGRPAVTGRRDGLLKQTARLPGADCCRSSSERAVDGRPWRAAGTDFWNKRHGFLAPIVAEVRQSGPWTAGRDGPPGGTFETNGTDSWRRLLQKSVRAGRGSRPWTAGRDGPPGRTFETNGTDSWRRLLQKSVRAGRGRPAVTGRRNGLLKQTARIPGADCCKSPSERAVGSGRGRLAVTGRRDGLLKQTARIPGADCCRSSSERAVGAGRGRTAVTGCWDELLKQTARIPGADCFKSLSDRAVHVNQAAYHVYFSEPHWNSMGLPEITIW